MVPNDLKHAFRMLARNPGYTLAAVAALALGIGANTAIFSVINTVLLKPLTYPDPDRIVQLMNTSPNGTYAWASIPNFSNWRDQTSVLQDVAAFDQGGSESETRGGPELSSPFPDTKGSGVPVQALGDPFSCTGQRL